jgi:DNA-binding MarR family transcriptional regulator
MAYAGYREHFIGGTLKERRARKEEKFNTLLDFLVKETYADTATLAELLGISKQTTTAALKNLVDRGLVMGAIIPVGGTKYWGITRQGILLAEQIIQGIGESADIKHFVPSMFSDATKRHRLAVQKAIIHKEAILKRFWKVDGGRFNFENPYQYLLHRGVKQPPNFSKLGSKEKTVFPDSIFTVASASGILAVAVEVELSIKAKARYKAIFTGHWRNHRQGNLYNGVVYVFETKKAAKSFRENILNPLIERTLEGDKFVEFLQSRVRLISFEALTTSRDA